MPVNPHIDEALGEIGYPGLKSVSGIVDMVNVFRRSEFVGGTVDDAIQIVVKYIWMQEEWSTRMRLLGRGRKV